MDTTSITVVSGERPEPFVKPAGKPQSPRKWKLVKNWTTRITVIRRFGRKYCNKSFQLSISPGLMAESPQMISKVQDLIEKSNLSESTSTDKQPGYAPTSGALFSPHRTPAQDTPNQKGLFLNVCDVFKDHLALSPLQILLTLLSLQICQEDPPDESTTAGLFVVTVVVIGLAQGMEGTAPTDLARIIIQISTKKQFLFLGTIICFLISGAHAENQIETCKVPDPDVWEMHLYAKVAAFTILAVLGGPVVVRRMINRQRPQPVPIPVPIPVLGIDDIMDGLVATDYRKSNPNLAILKDC